MMPTGSLRIWPTPLIGPAVFYVDTADVVYIPEHNGGLVSVLTLEGERLAQWGDPSFRSCHSIWGDSRGDLYVVRPGTGAGTGSRGRRIVKHVRLR
jgi:sugar lactone lactonase YvrE